LCVIGPYEIKAAVFGPMRSPFFFWQFGLDELAVSHEPGVGAIISVVSSHTNGPQK